LGDDGPDKGPDFPMQGVGIDKRSNSIAKCEELALRDITGLTIEYTPDGVSLISIISRDGSYAIAGIPASSIKRPRQKIFDFTAE
jgi:hypothetical protein